MCVDSDPIKHTVFDEGLSTLHATIETNLVREHDKIFIHQETLDFIITFAVRLAMAFNQLDVYKSCLRRVKVTVYAQFILVDAHELLMIKFELS